MEGENEQSDDSRRHAGIRRIGLYADLADWHDPLEKLDDRGGKNIIAVTRHHVGRIANIHILSMGTLLEETLGSLLTQHVGKAPTHQQRWQVEMIGTFMQSCPVVGFIRIRPPKTASRIPVPVVLAVSAESHVFGQTVQLAWTRPVR